MEKEDYTRELGKPKYKAGEEVCFVWGKDKNQEAKGRICIIDAYGTWEQQKEVSYDIDAKHLTYFFGLFQLIFLIAHIITTFLTPSYLMGTISPSSVFHELIVNFIFNYMQK